jgi:hypothetical protein
VQAALTPFEFGVVAVVGDTTFIGARSPGSRGRWLVAAALVAAVGAGRLGGRGRDRAARSGAWRARRSGSVPTASSRSPTSVRATRSGA